MKRFVIPLFCLSIVVAAMLACTDGGKNTATKSNTGDTSNTTKEDAKAAPAKHFKPDETVNVGDIWEIVVTNVRVVPPGQYDSLKAGNMYLGMDVSFKNISKEEAELFGSAGWTLKDTQGQSYNTTYVSDYPNAPDGKIEPGGPAKGSLVFEVPEATREYRLAYENNMWTSGQAVWDLTV